MRAPVLALGLGLTVVGFASYAYFATLHPAGFLRACFDGHAARLQQRTSFLLLRVSGRAIAGVQFAVVPPLFAGGLAAKSGVLFALAIALASLPSLVLSRRAARRLRRLDRQLEGWLLMLATSLRAAPSVVEGISTTLSLVPAPFAEEVDLVAKEIRLGSSLRRALDSMSRRVPSTSVRSALATIVAASETGGDLPGILETTADSLRESDRLDGVLRTKTAEGRGQLTLLASMPFVLFLGIRWLDPTYFEPVARSSAGRGLLAICIALWLAASLWAYRIVSVDL